MFRKKGKLAALLAAVLTLTLAQTEFLQIYATETNEETSGRAAGDIAVDSAHFPDPAFWQKSNVWIMMGTRFYLQRKSRLLHLCPFLETLGSALCKGLNTLQRWKPYTFREII